MTILSSVQGTKLNLSLVERLHYIRDKGPVLNLSLVERLKVSPHSNLPSPLLCSYTEILNLYTSSKTTYFQDQGEGVKSECVQSPPLSEKWSDRVPLFY